MTPGPFEVGSDDEDQHVPHDAVAAHRGGSSRSGRPATRRCGIIPPSYADRFKSQIRNARVEIVNAAAHQVILDQPARAAQLVREFCAD